MLITEILYDSAIELTDDASRLFAQAIKAHEEGEDVFGQALYWEGIGLQDWARRLSLMAMMSEPTNN